MFCLFSCSVSSLSALEQFVYVKTLKKSCLLSLKFSNVLLGSGIIAFNSIQISESEIMQLTATVVSFLIDYLN